MGGTTVCLAIPGQIVDVVDEPNRLARVDVAGVRRTVNIGLLDKDADGGAGPGDWVLIHVGFALSKVDEDGAEQSVAVDLVEPVAVGDDILVHAGVAIAHMGRCRA